MRADRQDPQRPQADAVRIAGVLSQVARRNVESVRGGLRAVGSHLGDFRNVRLEARSGRRPVPAVQSARRPDDPHLFRVRRATGVRGAPGALGSDARQRVAQEAAGRVCRTFGSRDQGDPAHAVFRLFPNRLGLHPLRQGAAYPCRPRARLGRRLARGLRHVDHRSGPAAVRPALRAVPEYRAQIDARRGHRFLHEPARRGDSLRHGEVRPRAGFADHHLQHDEDQGGHQGCRPGDGHEFREGGPPYEARAERAEHLVGRCDRPRAENPRGDASGQAGRRVDQDRETPRGRGAQFFRACRRSRDRPAAAHEPRSHLQDWQGRNRHAVRHEEPRPNGAPQDGLPRPDDADHH